jgi:hypothetical protein
MRTCDKMDWDMIMVDTVTIHPRVTDLIMDKVDVKIWNKVWCQLPTQVRDEIHENK